MNDLKNNILELNKKISIWTIGNNIDRYLKFYFYLIENEVFDFNMDDRIKLYNDFSGSLSDSVVASNQSIIVLQILDLVKIENNICFLMNHDIKNQVGFDFYIDDILRYKNITGEEQENKFWYSFIILNLLWRKIITIEEVLMLKQQHGNVKESFYGDYIKDEKTTNSLITSIDDEFIYKFLEVVSYKDIDCEDVEEYNNEIFENTKSKRDEELQNEFRLKLIDEANDKKIYGCWLCSKNTTNILQASHIIDHQFGGSFDINNGLLLCPTCHALFDNRCFIIDPMTCKLDYTLSEEDNKLNYEDRILKVEIINIQRKKNLLEKYEN